MWDQQSENRSGDKPNIGCLFLPLLSKKPLKEQSRNFSEVQDSTVVEKAHRQMESFSFAIGEKKPHKDFV